VTERQAEELGKQIADAILFNPGHISSAKLIAGRLMEIDDMARKQQRELDAHRAERQVTGADAAAAIRGV